MDCDFDRLDLSTNPYLEKNLEFLCNWIDDLSNEQQKFNQYTRNVARQKQVQQHSMMRAMRTQRADKRTHPTSHTGLHCNSSAHFSSVFSRRDVFPRLATRSMSPHSPFDGGSGESMLETKSPTRREGELLSLPTK